MMVEKYCFEIQDIISKYGLVVRAQKEGNFRFPIYMTEELKETDINVLDLSVRAHNCLRRSGINTIGEFCEGYRGNSEVVRIRNCGRQSIIETLTRLFCYQYSILSKRRRRSFLERVVQMNK